MKNCVCALTLALLAVYSPAELAAQATPPDVASLEDLLKVHVVTAASKFPQEVREAPASVTVVTADDIRRFGHRTLADVLKSVRGLYATYDRNYSYVGIRGFSLPGDYNTRVLLLVDGHRMNDAIYDMAPIGTDFPLDVSLIDRVEVIRGPGSSLYGTNAVFAVINVVTRTGAQHSGLRLDTYAGSMGTRGGTASYGRLFRSGAELLVAGSLLRADGASRLEYPEFDGEIPGSGVAVNLDHDESTSLFGSFARGYISMRGGMATRAKQVPTASFAAAFGDSRLVLSDARTYLSADFDGPVGRDWAGTARVAYDYYRYEGNYPYDYGLPERVLWFDEGTSHMLGAEATARRRFGSHQVTLGTEVRANFKNHMFVDDGLAEPVSVKAPGTSGALYAQDEIRVFDWMLFNGGLRLDRSHSSGSSVTPRAGIVLLPRPQTSVKLLYGTAFRAPNSYELGYYPSMNTLGLTLEPERVRSAEMVWEEHLGSRVRSTVSAFHYDAHSIIELRSIPGGDNNALYFANAAQVDGTGLELELEARLSRGLNATWSHAYARTSSASGDAVSNSPRHLSKFALMVPIRRFFLGIEGQSIGARFTRDGSVDRAFVSNVILTSPAGSRFDMTAGLYNVLDNRYRDPGAEEHVQDSIQQDGRTFLVRARVRFQ